MYQYSFEKLEVWQLSRVLVSTIYRLTEDFPDAEKFGLTNQLRRAVISISSNLAEGSSRESAKDQAWYTQIAFGSLLEVLNQMILANDLAYIDDKVLKSLRPKIEEIGNKLNALRNAQQKRINK